MDTNRILNIFIASPGDIVIERKIVREVCTGLNESDLLHHLGVSIHSKMWEEVFPSSEDSQAIINRVTDVCDVLVCIFYKRFYPRSGRIESENLNKFLLSYDSWKTRKRPYVMFYFKEVEGPHEGHPTTDANEIYQLKEQIEKENILFTDEFSQPYEFCEKIYDHLETWIRDNTNKH